MTSKVMKGNTEGKNTEGKKSEETLERQRRCKRAWSQNKTENIRKRP